MRPRRADHAYRGRTLDQARRNADLLLAIRRTAGGLMPDLGLCGYCGHGGRASDWTPGCPTCGTLRARNAMEARALRTLAHGGSVSPEQEQVARSLLAPPYRRWENEAAAKGCGSSAHVIIPVRYLGRRVRVVVLP